MYTYVTASMCNLEFDVSSCIFDVSSCVSYGETFVRWVSLLILPAQLRHRSCTKRTWSRQNSTAGRVTRSTMSGSWWAQMPTSRAVCMYLWWYCTFLLPFFCPLVGYYQHLYTNGRNMMICNFMQLLKFFLFDY